MWLDEDWQYLVAAYRNGGACVVSNVAHRKSLQKLGYMEPAPSVRPRFSSVGGPFTMALTKEGQKRAREIYEEREARFEHFRHQTRGAQQPMIFTGKSGKPMPRSTIPSHMRYRITGRWYDENGQR